MNRHNSTFKVKPGTRSLTSNRPLNRSGYISPAVRAGKRYTGLKSKVDTKLAAWSRRVKRRDGFICQWAGCEFCGNHEGARLDAHHKALRSARPDLCYVDENAITICRQRHSWIHSEQGRAEAIERGFLSLRSRELAVREGTLGAY